MITMDERVREYSRLARERFRKKHPNYWKNYYKKYNRKSCTPDFNDYWEKTNFNYDRQRKQARKLKFIRMLGGRCLICGYNENIAVLHFHHVNPDNKEKSAEWLHKGFEEKVRKGELILLCSNCHKELHEPQCSVEGILFEKFLTTINSFYLIYIMDKWKRRPSWLKNL